MADDIRTVTQIIDTGGGREYQVTYTTDREKIGGYSVPRYVISKKSGIKAWIQRKLHNPDGWTRIDYHKQLRDAMDRKRWLT